MKWNKQNRLEKAEVWKNQFWQRNGQIVTLLLVDHLPIKIYPFSEVFSYGYTV